ncbi:MAG: cytochrome-c peroxidase [Flavobacteriales bacterium]|nr:cytochrome-c peroxidase [Flavobacteriales bacterium]
MRHARPIILPATVFVVVMMAVLPGCRKDPVVYAGEEAGWPTPADLDLPPGVLALLGMPDMPLDNPLTVEGIALGRRLFYEKALSDTQTMSCASCHRQGNAFSDPRAFSVGTDGRVGTRNSMTLANLAWGDRMFWDGRVHGLEAQAHDPVVDPLEMNNSWPVVEQRLNADAEYRQLFRQAFGTTEIDSTLVTHALAQFIRTMTSFDSPFDRYWFGGDTTAMSEEALNGLALFTSQGKCAGCHTLGLFTDNAFRNNGLDLVVTDPGLGAVTGDPGDLGRFKVPTLRNIAVTAPYMHDSRFATLEEVLGHYNGGVHMASPTVDPLMDFWGMNPAPFSPNEIIDLMAFLHSLTDETFLLDPRFAEP